MGKTVTCTYQVTVNLSKGASPMYGAMSMKEIKGILASEVDYQGQKGIAVVNAEIWPQTKRGRNQLEKDYAVITPDGHIDHYIIGEPKPFYTFGDEPSMREDRIGTQRSPFGIGS